MRLKITDVRTLKDDVPRERDLEFRGMPVSIGSHSKNLVQLADTEIAAYYAMLLPSGEDQWIFQPLTADGATRINGEPVHEPTELDDGDVIEISHFSLVFSLDVPTELVLPEPGNVEELAKIRQYPLPPRSEVRKPDADVSLNATRQRALAQFLLKLRACADYAKLLETTVEMLLPELNARTVWMGVRREPHGPLDLADGRSDKGKYSAQPPRYETYEYRCLTRHQHILVPKTGDAETQSVLAVPVLGKRGALGLIYADTRRRQHVFDDADLDFVTLIAGIIAPQLEAIFGNYLEQREQLNTGGLALIQDVQAKLDPRSVPQWPELQIAAYAKPGLKNAGDVYDVMRLPNGLLALLIGHVYAGSTRTALAMAEARSAFRIAGLHADRPHIQLKALNWLFHDERDACSADLAVLVMNPKTGAVEYASAGEIGVMIIDARGNSRRLADASIPRVGQLRSHEYTGASERLRTGDFLAFYTRGVPRASNASGETLGEERFVEALCDGFGQAASAALNELLVDLGLFLKAGRNEDDITLLLVRKVDPGQA